MNIFSKICYEKCFPPVILQADSKILPMKNFTTGLVSSQSSAEKKSESILIEKMGMSKREIREVYNKYGVPATKLVELMQLSKYQFVHPRKISGQCEPCMMITKLQPAV